MRWPWQSRVEKRESAGFTDALTSAILAQAAGSLTSDPAGLAALEVAAGMWARAFAAATVEPQNERTAAITPAVRALIARDLIRRGESVHLVDVMRGRVALHPVGSWDVRGSWLPADWWIRCDLFGPSGNITKFVPHDAVAHVRYATTADRPWHGVSPLAWAASTGALAANLEHRLAEEAGSPVGSFIPIPADGGDDDDDDDPMAVLKAGIAAAKGNPVLVETTQSGWKEGRVEAPQTDWKPNRFGASPPVVLEALRTAAGSAVMDACGVPSSLAMPNADGTSQREAWRRFVMGAVERF